jgi:hypothetical protein
MKNLVDGFFLMNLEKSNSTKHNTQQYDFTECNKRINTHIKTTTQDIL